MPKLWGTILQTEKSETIQRTGLNRIFADRKRGFSLRMAPMIDMIFLLLIFFLVTAKWRPKENFLPFQLPTAQGSEAHIGKAEPLIIYIWGADKNYRVQIGQLYSVKIKNENIEADLAGLMEKIKSTLVTQKRYVSDPIEIICDQDVKWEHLAKIYNLFFGAGLTDITFRMTE